MSEENEGREYSDEYDLKLEDLDQNTRGKDGSAPADKWKLFEARFNYAFEAFKYNADQRAKVFHFFLLFAGALATAYGFLFRAEAFWPATWIAGLGFLISFSFRFLDHRNEELVHVAEANLLALEKDVIYRGYRRPIYWPHRRPPTGFGMKMWKLKDPNAERVEDRYREDNCLTRLGRLWRRICLTKLGRLFCKRRPKTEEYMIERQLGIHLREARDNEEIGGSPYQHGIWIPLIQFFVAVGFLGMAFFSWTEAQGATNEPQVACPSGENCVSPAELDKRLNMQRESLVAHFNSRIDPVSSGMASLATKLGSLETLVELQGHPTPDEIADAVAPKVEEALKEGAFWGTMNKAAALITVYSGLFGDGSEIDPEKIAEKLRETVRREVAEGTEDLTAEIALTKSSVLNELRRLRGKSEPSRPEPIGARAPVAKLLFAPDDYQIDDSHTGEIERVIAVMKPNSIVSVYGFADRTGKHDWNLLLAYQRALAAARVLIEHDIDKESIRVLVGPEDFSPLQTPDGVSHPENRAVHIYIDSSDI